MEKKVFLTRQELNDLRNYTKEAGHGSDGRVFPYKKKYLIKLYRKSLTLDEIAEVDKNGPFGNDEDIKIYVMKKDRDAKQEKEYKANYKNNHNQFITYYKKDDDIPEHDTKLAASEAISAAIRRQSKIKRTKLPVASVYYTHKFIGCIIEKLNGISIHKLMWLPMKAKIKIINSVIDDLEELMNNHVYHKDLSNSPYANVGYIDENGKQINEPGHSHVLVNPITLKTNIIDLDGKSTIYTERDDDNLKEACIRELLVLVLEYVFAVQLYDYSAVEAEAEYNYLVNSMKYQGFSKDQLDEYVYYVFNNCHELDDVRKLVKTIELSKGL